MCGLVYKNNFDGTPVNRDVIKRYHNQKMRGRSGFGFYLPGDNRLIHNTKEGRILRLLKRYKASEVMYHHRFPTSTANVRNACHPFSTHFEGFANNYVLIHNGVLYNDDVLQKAHASLGIKYISEQDDLSFNDSEALLYDLALYLEGQQTELKAEGSIAFIMIERDPKTNNKLKLHFGRNYGSPLKMQFNKKSLTLASEGEGEDVDANMLYTFNYATRQLTKRDLTIPSYNYNSQWATGVGSGASSDGWRSSYDKGSSGALEQDWEDQYIGGIGQALSDEIFDKAITQKENNILKDANWDFDLAMTNVQGEIAEYENLLKQMNLDIVQADDNGDHEYAEELADEMYIWESQLEMYKAVLASIFPWTAMGLAQTKATAEAEKVEAKPKTIGFLTAGQKARVKS